MKKNFFRNSLAGVLVMVTTSGALAEDIKTPSLITNSSIEISGYFDFYFQSSPQGHAVVPATSAGPDVLEGRTFDRHVTQTTLNVGEISFKKKQGKVLFRADLAAGEVVDQLSGGGSQSVTGSGAGQNPTNTAANEPTRNLTQATVTYLATDRLSLTLGKFYTHVGLEGTKAKDNYQYSRSYTYNFGTPFWHEGVSGTYAIVPEKFSATLYLLNAWDGRVSQKQNKSTTVGTSFIYTGPEGVVASYNYIGGAESSDQSRRELHEVNLTYSLLPNLIFATEYVYGTQKKIPLIGDTKWIGLALYVKAVLGIYSISPRYEIFDDSDNGFAVAGGLSTVGTKQKITSWTLANNFDLGDGLEARAELRSDKSDSNLFFKSKDGSAIDHQESFTTALLYSF